MKLVTYLGPPAAEPRVGVVLDDRVLDVTDFVAGVAPEPALRRALAERGVAAPPAGMLRLLQGGPPAMAALARHVQDRPAAPLPMLADVRLAAPVPRPGKIVAVGRNYADHAKETGVDPFEQPRIIAKLPSSVSAPGAVVRRPAPVAKLDFEAELAVVIGTAARNVARAAALDHVAGYTVLNDLSAREFQFDISPPQTTFAKSMDGFCPMGPWLVTRDEIADPHALEVSCRVNGQPMQHASTADMLFRIDRLIEYVTQFMTLEPGDVIATGTPAGIGAFRQPPVWLQPGDTVRIEITGIGVLEHGIG